MMEARKSKGEKEQAKLRLRADDDLAQQSKDIEMIADSDVNRDAQTTPDASTTLDARASQDSSTDESSGKQAVDSTASMQNNYELEILTHSIEKTIQTLIGKKLSKEADIASRLLVDLSEGRISVSEARNVLSLMDKQIAESHAATKPETSRKSFLSDLNQSVVILVALIALIVGGTLCATSVHSPPTSQLSDFTSQIWKYLPVASEETLRSINSRVATNFTITNKLNGIAYVYWIDFDGKRDLKMTLQPGETQGELTYVGHPFVVVDEHKKPILLFVPGYEPDKKIEIK